MSKHLGIYTQGAEVSLLHGFQRLQSRSRGLSVAQLVCLRAMRNVTGQGVFKLWLKGWVLSKGRVLIKFSCCTLVPLYGLHTALSIKWQQKQVFLVYLFERGAFFDIGHSLESGHLFWEVPMVIFMHFMCINFFDQLFAKISIS